MTEPTLSLGQAFLERSRTFLADEFLPRVAACVQVLEPADLWWRPNQNSNSVGNLILHLAGNTRQWIIAGVGGVPDIRARDKEFAAREGLGGSELMAALEGTVAEAARVLAALDPALLLVERSIQGKQVTLLHAVYHVVEHFSMHTGQIIYITKLRTGRDLGFYGMVDGVPERRWR